MKKITPTISFGKSGPALTMHRRLITKPGVKPGSSLRMTTGWRMQDRWEGELTVEVQARVEGWT